MLSHLAATSCYGLCNMKSLRVLFYLFFCWDKAWGLCTKIAFVSHSLLHRELVSCTHLALTSSTDFKRILNLGNDLDLGHSDSLCAFEPVLCHTRHKFHLFFLLFVLHGNLGLRRFLLR